MKVEQPGVEPATCRSLVEACTGLGLAGYPRVCIHEIRGPRGKPAGVGWG